MTEENIELKAYLRNTTFGTLTLTTLRTYLETLHLDSDMVEKIVFAIMGAMANKGATNNTLFLIDKLTKFTSHTTGASLAVTVDGIGWILHTINGYNHTQTSDTRLFISGIGESIVAYTEWLQKHANASIKSMITEDLGRPDLPIFLPNGTVITALTLTYTSEDEVRLRAGITKIS